MVKHRFKPLLLPLGEEIVEKDKEDINVKYQRKEEVERNDGKY